MFVSMIQFFSYIYSFISIVVRGLFCHLTTQKSKIRTATGRHLLAAVHRQPLLLRRPVRRPERRRNAAERMEVNQKCHNTRL